MNDLLIDLCKIDLWQTTGTAVVREGSSKCRRDSRHVTKMAVNSKHGWCVRPESVWKWLALTWKQD